MVRISYRLHCTARKTSYPHSSSSARRRRRKKNSSFQGVFLSGAILIGWHTQGGGAVGGAALSPRASCAVSMDVSSVNALSYEDFVDVLGNVVERCPLVAAAAWSARPFLTLRHLEAAMCSFIDALPLSGETHLQTHGHDKSLLATFHWEVCLNSVSVMMAAPAIWIHSLKRFGSVGSRTVPSIYLLKKIK